MMPTQPRAMLRGKPNKVCRPESGQCSHWKSIFDWYMARLVIMKEYQNTHATMRLDYVLKTCHSFGFDNKIHNWECSCDWFRW